MTEGPQKWAQSATAAKLTKKRLALNNLIQRTRKVLRNCSWFFAYKHCLGEVLCILHTVQKMTAASQCTCEATQWCHFKILLPTICHNMMTKATRSSTSTRTTCLIAWAGKRLPEVQENSATVLESQETKRLSQTKLRGFGGPGRCKLNPVGFLTDVPPQEKRAEQPSSSKPTLQTQVSRTLCSSLKASHMAFCCCFQPPSPAFSTEDGAPESLLESALRKGSPGATPFSYLYQ